MMSMFNKLGYMLFI